MLRILKILFSTILISALPITPVKAEESPCDIAQSALMNAAKLRHLQTKQEVPCAVWSREKIREHLLQRIAEEMPGDQPKQEGTIFRAIGMIPEDYNYEREIVELYTSQISGFYNQKDKYFIMVDNGVQQMQVAIHEQTHAIQDQNFDLEKLLDHKKFSGDELAARLALVEGDATAVMLDFAMLFSFTNLSKTPNVTGIILQNIIGTYFIPALQEVPQSIILTMLFPYTSGLRFVHHFLYNKDYSEIDKLYAAPPRSTEEILHPEKYGTAVPDFKVFSDADVLKAFKVSDQKALYSDVMGELGISALLQNLKAPNSAAAAAGWGGDKAVLLDCDNTKDTVLWLTTWDTERDAEEFLSAYLKGLAKTYPNTSPQLGKNKLSKLKTLELSKDGKNVLITVELKRAF